MVKYKTTDVHSFGILPVSLMYKFGLTAKRTSSNR